MLAEGLDTASPPSPRIPAAHQPELRPAWRVLPATGLGGAGRREFPRAAEGLLGGPAPPRLAGGGRVERGGSLAEGAWGERAECWGALGVFLQTYLRDAGVLGLADAGGCLAACLGESRPWKYR